MGLKNNKWLLLASGLVSIYVGVQWIVNPQQISDFSVVIIGIFFALLGLKDVARFARIVTTD